MALQDLPPSSHLCNTLRLVLKMNYEILQVYTQGLEPRGKKDMDDLFANVQASYSLSKKEEKN